MFFTGTVHELFLGISTKNSEAAKYLTMFQLLHGTADSVITMEQFAALANQLEAAGVKHEMVTYSGAPHAFTVFGSERYREDADRKSWRLFSEFLEENLR